MPGAQLVQTRALPTVAERRAVGCNNLIVPEAKQKIPTGAGVELVPTGALSTGTERHVFLRASGAEKREKKNNVSIPDADDHSVADLWAMNSTR